MYIGEKGQVVEIFSGHNKALKRVKRGGRNYQDGSNNVPWYRLRSLQASYIGGQPGKRRFIVGWVLRSINSLKWSKGTLEAGNI